MYQDHCLLQFLLHSTQHPTQKAESTRISGGFLFREEKQLMPALHRMDRPHSADV